MQLLTQEIKEKLPKLYATENMKSEEKKIIIKFFCPWNSWTWYAVEGEQQGNDFQFFGLVRGFENELGYFNLTEIESVNGPMGLKIERDMHFGFNHTLNEAEEKRI